MSELREEPDPRVVYLAGPEVFLPNAEDIGDAKKARCTERGLVGIFPFDDNDIHALDRAGDRSGSEETLAEQAHSVFERCIDQMNSSYALVANMTPFRGISTDVGTAVEVGYMHGLRRPVFGYTNVGSTYSERVRLASLRRGRSFSWWRKLSRSRELASWGFLDGSTVEPYSAFDNLMCEGPLWATLAMLRDADARVGIMEPAGASDLPLDDLSLFEDCLDRVLKLPKVQEALAQSPPPSRTG